MTTFCLDHLLMTFIYYLDFFAPPCKKKRCHFDWFVFTHRKCVAQNTIRFSVMRISLTDNALIYRLKPPLKPPPARRLLTAVYT